MSDSANAAAVNPAGADPGWYHDPAGSQHLRWWDGTAWTEHLALDPAPPRVAERHPLADGTPLYTVFIWLVVLLPLLTGITIWFWHPNFQLTTQTINGQSVQTIAPTSMFTPGYFLLVVLGWVLYGLTVVFAYLDYRWLNGVGVVRPFHWAWTFLGGIVYVIGRSVIVRRVAPKRGLRPIWVSIAVFVIVNISTGIWIGQLVSSMMGQLTQFSQSN